MRVEFIERWPDPTVTGREKPVPMALRKQKKWFVRMYGNKPTGPVVIASSIGQLRNTEHEAWLDAEAFPWVALIDEAGNHTYPFFNERKAKVKADARARNERRQRKAVEQLNLVMTLGSMLSNG